MTWLSAGREFGDQVRDGGRAGPRRAEIEDPRFVVTASFGHEAVPAEGAEQ